MRVLVRGTESGSWFRGQMPRFDHQGGGKTPTVSEEFKMKTILEAAGMFVLLVLPYAVYFAAAQKLKRDDKKGIVREPNL